MTIITSEEFLKHVGAWIKDNKERMHRIWPLKGGWEAWAQAEICAHIFSDQPLSDVLREQPIYSGNMQVDFLVNSGTKKVAQDVLAVELKCESLGNHQNFLEGFRADQGKLSQSMSKDFEKCTRLCMGIFTSRKAQDQIKQLQGVQATIVDDIGVVWSRYMPAN
jgi:hypothetical protein